MKQLTKNPDKNLSKNFTGNNSTGKTSIGKSSTAKNPAKKSERNLEKNSVNKSCHSRRTKLLQNSGSTRNRANSYLLAGGTMLAAMAVAIDIGGVFNSKPIVTNTCEEIIQPQAVISREQLSRLLTIPERDKKAKVRQLLKTPYCKLPSLEIRQGVIASREAYPLAFDTQTKIVILYEGDEYVGYAFKVDRSN